VLIEDDVHERIADDSTNDELKEDAARISSISIADSHSKFSVSIG
jgi:hypothetical protein